MGRLVFTSGEILTAANMNELSDQSVMVFADSSARSSAIPSPTEGMVTYVEDNNRVEVYDGSAFGPIGGILQVVSTIKTDTFSASVAAGAQTTITGLSASITPSSTSSKVLILASITGGGDPSTNRSNYYALQKDGSNVAVGDSAGLRRQTSTAGGDVGQDDGQGSGSINFLDSPSSTSSITYSITVGHELGSTRTVHVNRSAGDADAIQVSRTVSSITLMEVAV